MKTLIGPRCIRTRAVIVLALFLCPRSSWTGAEIGVALKLIRAQLCKHRRAKNRLPKFHLSEIRNRHDGSISTFNILYQPTEYVDWPV